MKNVYQNTKDNTVKVDVNHAWEKLNKRIEQAEKNDNIKKLRFEGFPVFYRIAAILVVVLAVVFSIYITIFNKSDMIVYTTEKNEVSRYILPDGTLIELNEMSELKHPKKFINNDRTVYLKGEAFFRVEHNPLKPFLVKTKTINVKVLGTSFNVLSRNEKNAEVLVEEGKVTVNLKNDENTNTNLIPGQIGILKGNRLKTEKNTDINYLSWKTKTIIFKETNLPEVVQTLNHTFNCNIEIKDDELKELKYTTTITNQPLSMILDALNTSFKEIEIINKKNKIVIYKK